MKLHIQKSLPRSAGSTTYNVMLVHRRKTSRDSNDGCFMKALGRAMERSPGDLVPVGAEGGVKE